MRFSTFAVATSALAGSAIAADHIVVAGKSGLTFEPANITAAKGDTVTFKFWPKSHSVVQSAFATPCEPLKDGFWSGFVPVAQGASNTTFQIKITNASQPLWFYCSRATHCQDGMVGVINAPASGNKTIDAYTNLAKNATENKSPTSAQALGGVLLNGTSSSGNATGGAADTGAASMLSASTGAVFTVAMGMVASLLL